MDAFSLAIVYGIICNNRITSIKLAITVSIFHFFMPYLGSIIGNIIPFKTNLLVGIIFVLLSIQMMFHNSKDIKLDGYVSFLLFGFTVSLDSFSIGIGLSQVANNILLAFMIFSLVSGILTFIGVRFGNLIGEKTGNKSTKLGSIILLILGLYYIF